MNKKEQNLYLKYRYIWEQLDNNMDSLFAYIQDYPYIKMDSYGNITVCNVPLREELPVFCCHLDTVHREEPVLECIKDDVLISLDGGGVGGDDKCGIVACLEMLESGIPCKCIFFRDEESGCKGSEEYNAESLKDDLFCIEIDRRGANDLIFSGSRGCMCGEEFQERVKKAFPHCSPAQGSLTDVCVLSSAEINMMNLSAGYYKPHTDKEYVVLSELKQNIDCLKVLTQDILDNPLKTNKYKRRESYGYTYYNQGTWYQNKGKTGALFESEQYAGADDYDQLQYGNRDFSKSSKVYFNGKEVSIKKDKK